MGFFEVFAAALSAFYSVIPSYGLAIILLTIAVRLILLPLSIKQTRSMREMQRIQPEVKRIQAKYKGDRPKMNEEMMALYKEHGVNPLGGCLPLIMQLPVLIGLFYVVRTPLSYMGFQAPPQPPKGIFAAPADFIARGVSGIMETLQSSSLAQDLIDKAVDVYHFLGLQLHCSASGIIGPPSSASLEQATEAGRELTLSCGTGFVSAVPYLVLVLLMGFTTWYQQKQMQVGRNTGDQQAQQMQMIGKIMPVMLMVFAYSFPTGVVLYWLTTNVWTIGQQRIMLRVAPPAAATGAPGDGKAARGPKPKPSSGSPPGKPEGVAGEAPPRASTPHPRKKRKR